MLVILNMTLSRSEILKKWQKILFYYHGSKSYGDTLKELYYGLTTKSLQEKIRSYARYYLTTILFIVRINAASFAIKYEWKRYFEVSNLRYHSFLCDF